MSAVIREPKAPREPQASTAAVQELRKGLRAIDEKHAAAQEEIAAVAGKLGATIGRYNQMQPLIAGGAAGLATATRVWKRAASRFKYNTRNCFGSDAFWFNY